MRPPLPRRRARPSREQAGRGEAAPTFVLGLGCQKGGTSWLHYYLAGSEQYVPGFDKELHVFDTLDFDEEKWQRNRSRALKQLEGTEWRQPTGGSWLLWAAMCSDPETYFDYFAGLLARGPQVRATGDLTPAYGVLSAERVAQIRASFESREIRTAAVFVMRDPVERAWSLARMLHRKFPRRYPLAPEETLAQLYGDPLYEARSRYDHTLGVLDEVFAPADRWIGFYEELLFDERSVSEVCDVVGIDLHPPDLETRRNASPKGDSQLPEELARSMAACYRPAYEAVAARYPDKDLSTLWPSSRFVL